MMCFLYMPSPRSASVSRPFDEKLMREKQPFFSSSGFTVAGTYPEDSIQ